MKINKEQIVTVYQYNKRKDHNWVYVEYEEFKFLWWVIEKGAKGYTTWRGNIFTAEQVLAESPTLYKDGDNFYELPHVQ